MLRKILIKLAHMAGYSTFYHVAYSGRVDGGLMVGHMTLTVQPWICKENYLAAMDEVARVSGIESKKLNVLSLTKL